MTASVGARLRIAREIMELNQDDFAQIGGVSRNSQIQYESDATQPKLNYFVRLGEAGVDLGYVLTGRVAADSLGPDESELLEGIRMLDPVWLKSLLSMIRSALDRDEQPAQATVHSPSGDYRSKR